MGLTLILAPLLNNVKQTDDLVGKASLSGRSQEAQSFKGGSKTSSLFSSSQSISHIFILVAGLAGGKVVSLLITFLGKVFHPAAFFLFISSTPTTNLQNFTGNTLKLRTHLPHQIFCLGHTVRMSSQVCPETL